MLHADPIRSQLIAFVEEIQELGLSTQTDRNQVRQPIEKEGASMDLLLSWSKSRSREMATVFHDWIPKVLPRVVPWMSEKDIAKGKSWWGELKGQLEKAKICIICVTKENVGSPWLHFEAGAFVGRGAGPLICPYLVGVERPDGPLALYQCTSPTKDDTFKLIKSLNRALDESKRYDEQLLEGNFDTQWPQFEAELERVLAMDVGKADEFVATDADKPAADSLSPEARTLLIEASRDEHGLISHTSDRGGQHIETNKKNLAEPGDPRSIANLKQAIQDLLSGGLLEARGKSGKDFGLTASGYNVADSLKK